MNRQGVGQEPVFLGMTIVQLTVTLLALAVLGSSVGSSEETETRGDRELAPGVRIERAEPNPETLARRARLVEWRPLFERRLAPLRASLARLFESLVHSSLETLVDHCQAILTLERAVERDGLFSSADVAIDRMVYGSLERLRAGGRDCEADRYLSAFHRLSEARSGFEWVDRRIERALRPPVRLPGLDRER